MNGRFGSSADIWLFKDICENLCFVEDE
jgi:hypothetical protein